MLFNRLIFVLIVFLVPYFSKKQEQRKMYFIDNDSLVILNGNVKQMTVAPVDDISSTNAGQDYDIVNINEQGDVSKITTGFHRSVFQTYYVTRHDVSGRKLETKGYIKFSDGLGILSDRFIRPDRKDTAKKLILTYKYNRQNEILNYVVNPGKPVADSSTYKYNDKGELVELDYYANPKLLMNVTKYKYDNNGNLIESDKFHWNKLMVRMRYKYDLFDLQNNWVDKTVNFESFLGDNGNETFKIHRKIIYY